MPRNSRLDAPGVLHHIIARGINRQAIFSDKVDYNDFLERLGKIVSETKTTFISGAVAERTCNKRMISL